MAYIDIDKFAERICNFQAIDEDTANKMIWLLRTFPTADVVPKSESEFDSIPVEVAQVLRDKAVEKAKVEVAREIFAEIEKNECHDISGKTTMYMLFTEELAELKKKYTEERE